MNETLKDQELCQKQSILGDMLRKNPFVIEMQWWVLVVIILAEIVRKLYGLTGYSSFKHYVTQIENIIEWFVIISVFLTSYIYNKRYVDIVSTLFSSVRTPVLLKSKVTKPKTIFQG